MQADALTWGHGPRILEVFLEPTCPFSVKAFRKLDKLLEQAGEDRLTIKIRLQSQPWHMFSGVIVRCILAASTLEGGRNTAKAVMAAVAAHRAEFEFEHHASGPNLDARRTTSLPALKATAVSSWPKRSHSPSLSTSSNGTANTPGRMAFMCLRPLWSTVWCSLP